MNKILYASVMVALLTSCASSYNVTGSSSVSALDGSKLYLKTLKSGAVRNIDSCDVVHGEFHFAGLLDSVRMANLFMDDESIMPVVLEEGEITVKIGPAGPSVGGTPLNDSLYKFIDRHNQLINQMNELGHKQNQMILEGIDEQAIAQQLNAEAAHISAAEDELVTKFIEANYDNVLGPGVFMMITSQYRYPILTPQIEYIMSKATKTFKEDPYVKEYYQTARENEQRMNGLSDPVTTSAPAPAPLATDTLQAPAQLMNAPKK
ncbi:MAG: DUF4369 domain-containing protein [Prevotella sp.]|nr:DUF4369 domain-containing protein [Prevotella sp.]